MITIYTTETCPKCKILKKKLEDKQLQYIDIWDENELLKLGIDEVPVLKVDDKLLNFGDAVAWVNNQ